MASASHVVVIDSTLRRASVKTEPGTYMSDILEEGCKKLGLKAEKYILKHNKKNVDMTRTFRQSGLPSGAKLELVVASRSAAPVAVALQLPLDLATGIPNGRLTSTFSSQTTFWQMLRQFESNGGRNLNITGRGVAQTQEGMTGAGRIFYEQPVCVVMGRELASIPDLQKTLASLGFNSGTCMIRLSFRVTSTPLEDAMSQISHYFKSIEEPQEAAAPAPEAPKTEKPEEVADKAPEVEMTDAPEKPEEVAGKVSEVEMTGAPEIPEEPAPTPVEAPAEILSQPVTLPSDTPVLSNTSNKQLGPGGREVTVFSAPTDSTPRAALQTSSDADFEPSIAHVKLHENRIKSESRNKRLPTEAEAKKLAEEKAAKQAAIKSVVIKLRLPDQMSFEGKFTSSDTAKDLYDYAKGMVRDGIELNMFTLTWQGDKGMRVIPRGGSEKLIADLGFSGRVLVNLIWDQAAPDDVRKGPVLKSQYAENAQDIQVPDVPQAEEEKEEDGAKGKAKAREGSGTSGSGNLEKKPKWFKLGKK